MQFILQLLKNIRQVSLFYLTIIFINDSAQLKFFCIKQIVYFQKQGHKFLECYQCLITILMEHNSGEILNLNIKEGAMRKIEQSFHQLEQLILLKNIGCKTIFERVNSVKNLRRAESTNQKQIQKLISRSCQKRLLAGKQAFKQAQLYTQLSALDTENSKKDQLANKQTMMKELQERKNTILKQCIKKKSEIQLFNRKNQISKQSFSRLQAYYESQIIKTKKHCQDSIHQNELKIRKRILKLVKPYKLQNSKDIEQINDHVAAEANNLKQYLEDYEQKLKILSNQKERIFQEQINTFAQRLQQYNRQLLRDSKLLEDLSISKVRATNQIKRVQCLEAVQLGQLCIFEAKLVIQISFESKIGLTNQRIQQLIEKRKKIQEVERTIMLQTNINSDMNQQDDKLVSLDEYLKEDSSAEMFKKQYSNMLRERNNFEESRQRLINQLNDRFVEYKRKIEQTSIQLNQIILNICQYEAKFKGATQKLSAIKKSEIMIMTELETRKKTYSQNQRLSQEVVKQISSKQEHMHALIEKISKSLKKEESKQLFEGLCEELNFTAEETQQAYDQISGYFDGQQNIAKLNSIQQTCKMSQTMFLNLLKASEELHQNYTVKSLKQYQEQLSEIDKKILQMRIQKQRRIDKRTKMKLIQDLKQELLDKKNKLLPLKKAGIISKQQKSDMLRCNQLVLGCELYTQRKISYSQNQQDK